MIVATEVVPLENVTAPASGVLTVGVDIVKSASSARYGPPGAVNPVKTGVPFVTVNDAVRFFEENDPYATFVAVKVTDPAPMIVT